MRWRGMAGVGASALVIGALTAGPASAQLTSPPDGILQVTTSTTASTTTTVAPPTTVAPGNSRQAVSPTAALPSTVSDDVPTDAGPFPPELQAAVNSVKRTKPNSTTALVAALAPLGALGLDAAGQAHYGYGNFPVAGLSNWTDDWWTPRFGPGWRLHEGVDMFAAYGTPVLAPAAGTVHVSNGGNGGLGIRLVEANTNAWYLAHLSALAPGIEEGSAVVAGQQIAMVGDSGNAAGGPAHLHLEFHPRGGGAAPPKPLIDRILAEVTAAAPAKVAAYQTKMASEAAATAAPSTAVAAAPDTHRLVQLLLAPLTPELLRWVLAD